MIEEREHDVVVVGGGPAGPGGAVTLARSRRRVLVVDAGAPRNAATEGVHNLLGGATSYDLGDGDLVRLDALVVQSRPVARSEVLTSLGVGTVELEMGGVSVAEHVATDGTGLTSQAGVWAAGNVSDPMAQVGASAAAGVRAAGAINADLAGEDARDRVQERRRETEPLPAGQAGGVS